MASANQTLSDAGGEFEADETERTATLRTPGGVVSNIGSNPAIIDVDANTGLTLAENQGGSKRYMPAGSSVQLPGTCRAFTFLAAASPANTSLSFSKG